jgi:anti-sigma regulatory factor (Ser/Thr protein kinase)
MVDCVQSSVEVSPDLTQVANVRRFVRSTLADLVPATVSSDLQLLASELVTNAIEHGASGSVFVEVTADDERAGLAVHSTGPSPGVGPVDSWAVADAEAITGRGLGIVKAIADVVEMRQSRDALVVTVYRDLLARSDAEP